MKKRTVLLIILDILAFMCLFLAYGPFSYLRTLYITTAMNTKTHQYLANVIYSEATIKEVMGKNYVEDLGIDSNEDDVKIDTDEKEVYDSIYEEQILKRDKDNDVYKIIELDGFAAKAYLTVIYDPSMLSTASSKYYGNRGEHVSDIARRINAIVAVNAGGFMDIDEVGNGSNALGIYISNGKIIEDANGERLPIIGMTNKNILVLKHMTAIEAIKSGVRDAVWFSPFLIVNGKKATIGGNGGMGINPRTAIAQRKDGIILFLTIDGLGIKFGFRGGATLAQEIEILERYGAYNAANLDGGASTTLVVNGNVYNSPVGFSETGERWLPNAWIVK